MYKCLSFFIFCRWQGGGKIRRIKEAGQGERIKLSPFVCRDTDSHYLSPASISKRNRCWLEMNLCIFFIGLLWPSFRALPSFCFPNLNCLSQPKKNTQHFSAVGKIVKGQFRLERFQGPIPSLGLLSLCHLLMAALKKQ